MSEVLKQTTQEKYSYWLIVESERLNHEYGLNDRFGFEEVNGSAHYFELPADSYLKNGQNTAFIRITDAEDTPKLVPTTTPENDQAAINNPDLAVFAKMSLKIMALNTRESRTVPLLTIQRNPITGKFTQTTGPSGLYFTIETTEQQAIYTKADPLQGKFEGYRVSFSIADDFIPLPYLAGQTFTMTTELETEVKAEMSKLLDLYKARDYIKLVNAYELSWKHIAITYDYGSSARSYADSVDFAGDLRNPDYDFFLDFSKSKLRVDANGKLVGFYPPPLVGKEPDDFIAIDFPVYFMRAPNGKLIIGG